MPRIRNWAEDQGHWRVGVGLFTMAMAYSAIGMTLAGYGYGHAQGAARTLLFAFQMATVLGLVIVSLLSLNDHRRFEPDLNNAAFAHQGLLLILLIAAWSIPAVTRPASAEEFREYIMPVAALQFAVMMPRAPAPAGVGGRDARRHLKSCGERPSLHRLSNCARTAASPSRVMR